MSEPGEVVTRSLMRLVRVPGLDRPAALITLDNGFDHTKPNTFGPQGLASLDSALDDAFAAEPAFIAITGKPYVFCVGADLTMMPLVRDHEQALGIGRLGHRVFARLRDSTVPTFAFLNGAAMGGGLELALHCHYRTLSSGAAALALPEVSLGLVPTWGGSQLLPNLIGIVNAARVIIQNPLRQNRMLRPAEAHKLGIADLLLDPADFLERSLEWAACVASGQSTVERPEIERGELWNAVIDFAREQLDEHLHGAASAPYRALDLLALAKDTPFSTGTTAEDDTLADLLLHPQLRNGLYAFDLVQRRAKRPAGAPEPGLAREVTKVGIVGAGLMAAQLALLFVRRLEVPVVLTDLDQDRLDKGIGYVRDQIATLVSKGRLSPGKAAKLTGLVSGSVDRSGFADADLVIEAVYEDLSVKQQVFADLEGIVRPECVLATNTSSLSVSAMAAGLAYPQRVVGLHFFNPVAVLPLLEVVRAERTGDATLATALAVGKKLKKSCVLVKDSPAFVVNRLLTRLLGEVLAAIAAGMPPQLADTALDPLGLPMRPLRLLTLVGPAIARHVGQTLHTAYPDRFAALDGLDRVTAAGKPLTDVDGVLDPQVAALLMADGSAAADGTTPANGMAAANGGTSVDEAAANDVTAIDELRGRALRALAEEISLMLAEGVVADPKDIDLCMILGAGWPFHTGGITPYLAQHGYLPPA